MRTHESTHHHITCGVRDCLRDGGGTFQVVIRSGVLLFESHLVLQMRGRALMLGSNSMRGADSRPTSQAPAHNGKRIHTHKMFSFLLSQISGPGVPIACITLARKKRCTGYAPRQIHSNDVIDSNGGCQYGNGRCCYSRFRIRWGMWPTPAHKKG